MENIGQIPKEKVSILCFSSHTSLDKSYKHLFQLLNGNNNV